MKRSTKYGALLLLLAAPAAVWFSSWEIEEARYSPFSLEYQKRRSLVVFAGELPIYRGDWEPAVNDVLDYVTEAHFVNQLPSEDQRWDLVHRFKTGQEGGWKRPSRSLNTDLVVWSKRHPDIAPTFWQTGLKLVRSDEEQEVAAGYVLLGDLWEACETGADLRGHLELLEQVFHVKVLSEAHAHLPKPKKKPKSERPRQR